MSIPSPSSQIRRLAVELDRQLVDVTAERDLYFAALEEIWELPGISIDAIHRAHEIIRKVLKKGQS